MDELHQLWPEARDVFANITDPALLARARCRDTIMEAPPEAAQTDRA